MTERFRATAPQRSRRLSTSTDITLAFTPGQLILIVIGLFVLLRILRGLRG